MKLNWGFGITVFVIIFISFMLTLVYKCSQQKVDLVSEKYYENELKYQEQINKEENSLALAENVNVRYNGTALLINYPQEFNAESINGKIELFRPDDAKKDLSLDVNCDDKHVQEIPASNLAKGLWNVKVNWNNGGKPYFFEKKIMIN